MVQTLQPSAIMPRVIKIGLIILAVGLLLPIVLIVALFAGMSHIAPSPSVRREIHLPNQGTLIIDGTKRSRSEHGFSQHAGYRSPGSAEIEWFGDVSDGVEPQVYLAGPLVVVIDPPAAQIFVRTDATHNVVRPASEQNWKSFALIFPNDLGQFSFSFYAEKNGLTIEEVSQINELGGKRERKYPTTYIQSFDPETRDLNCSYHVDNMSSWPLHLRLSNDGTHLTLIRIGEQSP